MLCLEGHHLLGIAGANSALHPAQMLFDMLTHTYAAAGGVKNIFPKIFGRFIMFVSLPTKY